jgi:hypothetical protein
MSPERTTETSYPYPLRPSELVNNPEFISSLDVEPIPLTEQEQQQLMQFDQELYEQYKSAKSGEVGNHVIYPDQFTDKQGQRIFSAVCTDQNLWNQVRETVKKSKSKSKSELYDAAFDDILRITENDDEYQRFQEKGARFTNLEEALQKLGSESSSIQLTTAPSEDELSEEQITQNFARTDLRKIPSQIRSRANTYSSQKAQEDFKEKFRQQSGALSEHDAPKRVGKIVSPTGLKTKLRSLRETKTQLKAIKREIRENEDGNLAEAKLTLANLYQRQINYKIAGLYSSARLFAESDQPKRRAQKEALDEVYGFSADPESLPNIPRVMERIDHFLQGVGLEIAPNGLFQTIPGQLAEHIETKIEQSKDTNPEYEKYNAHKVNAEQMAMLCDATIAHYGWDKLKKPWRAKVDKTKRRMTASLTAKTIKIPPKLKHGIVDALAVTAHELEGHAIRQQNKSALKGNLKIISEVAGRSGILSEAGAMGIESTSKQEMAGLQKSPLPYYYLVLREKSKGGNFANCFQTYFEAKAKRDFGLKPQEAINDQATYDKVFSAAYGATLRIFRNHTPLGDTSGYIPRSDELEYAEQEIVGEALLTDEARALGLDNLLFIKGIDLYSLYELQRLGALDLGGVQKPDMFPAKVLWPEIKKSLDEGKSLEEIMPHLTST